MTNENMIVNKCFNIDSIHWTKGKGLNFLFVESILRQCKAEFWARKYLFLNEIYQKLDFPQTKEGQVMGWVYDELDEGTTLWTAFITDHNDDCVYITFENLRNILDYLPAET